MLRDSLTIQGIADWIRSDLYGNDFLERRPAAMSQDFDVFANAPVPRAVFTNAFPAMAAMLMVLIYNLADTFFVGQTHDALMVAAVSLATPVFLIFTALGAIFGIGGTSVIARAFGEGRKDFARKVSSFCMGGSILVGLAFSAAVFLWTDPILRLIGASEGTWAYTEQYLLIVTAGGPFVLISNCYSNIIRAEGKPTTAMVGQIIGNLLNVVLDPVMIFGLGWGVSGAAWATTLSNLLGALFYLYYLYGGHSLLTPSLQTFTCREGILQDVLSIGIPASLGNLLMSVSNIAANTLIAAYGDMAVAGFGVALKITMITGMLCIGFGQGIQPLLGYCLGARKWDRFQKVLRFSCLSAFALSSLMTVGCYHFIQSLVRAFLSDPSAYAYAVKFAGILLTTSFFFGLYYVLLNALQAMGDATRALVINLSRQGLIYLPVLFFLNARFGVSGLLWAQPVADVLSLLLVLVLYASAWQAYRKERVGHGTL